MTTDEISERLFKVRDHWREAHALTPDETQFLLGAVSQLLGQVEHLENYCDEECRAAHKTRQPPDRDTPGQRFIDESRERLRGMGWPL